MGYYDRDYEFVMDNLLGCVVTGLEISTDQSVLVFTTDQGQFFYETDGDCCSETWIADIVGVSNLLGQRVLKAEDVELDSVEDGRTRQEYDQFYGIKLTTSRGYVDIVYRNSSNGYYGGDLNRSDAESRGVRRVDFVQITDDYSA